ncbi:MAG: shikimate kinase [Chloroflexi bacterium]|nr:shikimate kinase [Chloroflexota bacterium]
MKTSIALVGFMGTGKTAVGQVLAQKTGKQFVEMDALIVQKAGKPIPDIFQQEGEIAFRELEISVTKELAGKKDVVIACGGGVVLNRINIDRLKQEAVIVYLTASPGAILKRTASDTGRPLLNVADRAAKTREILRFRKPFYERAADITVDTTKLGIEDVAEQIVDRLCRMMRFHVLKEAIEEE